MSSSVIADSSRAQHMWSTLVGSGVLWWSGVPCSLLGPLYPLAEADRTARYVPAAREDLALGVASGAYLAGSLGGLLIQNSGLGHLVNGLTSFNLVYQIPVLIVVSWRGFEGQDAPEHRIMGPITPSLFELLEVPYAVLPEDERDVSASLRDAVEQMQSTRTPVARIMPPGYWP